MSRNAGRAVLAGLLLLCLSPAVWAGYDVTNPSAGDQPGLFSADVRALSRDHAVAMTLGTRSSSALRSGADPVQADQASGGEALGEASPFDRRTSNINAPVTPEPASAFLLLLGAPLAIWARRRAGT